jgi:serine/threonine protein kinase
MMSLDTKISDFFVVGGTLSPNSHSYIERPADDQLLKLTLDGKFCYVLTARQTGKSSLMIRTAQRLKKQDRNTAIIDLTGADTEVVTADQWFLSLLTELQRQLRLSAEVEAWWHRHAALGPVKRFTNFMRDVLLVEIKGQIVIFIDEIDATLTLPFASDFFAAIRFIYNARATDSTYGRLTFVLLGVATPDDLIKDSARTPFNIGQAIELRDFTKQECEPFHLKIKAKYPNRGNQYFNQVYEWTGGHPYLTQKLCYDLIEEDIGELEEDSSDLVEALVRKLFLAPDRDDSNLHLVQAKITDDPYRKEMLTLYERVLQEETVYDNDELPAINRLKLYGLVVAHDGKLRVRNKLYAHVFDEQWVDKIVMSEELTEIARGVEEVLRTRPEPPKIVRANYEIFNEIGRGGFAAVYLARSQEPGQAHSIALKVLDLEWLASKKAEIDRLKLIKRFEREADVIAALDHPNIIRIFATGSDEETLFIAMEYISGGTLSEKLGHGPLSRTEAMHIVKHIGSALAHAHEQGIVHLDVNPNNILLDTIQEPIRPVLTDFGLAKLWSADDPRTRIITESLIGTLRYMAPEQLMPGNLITPAADLYALAITFFEMLAGKPPFESNSTFELMSKQLNEPLPRLSSMTPNVGPFFDDILGKAAEKNPSDRYQKVTDFIEALEAANVQAEQAELRANKIIEAVRSYTRIDNYNPEIALAMIKEVFDILPGYHEALKLRAKIWLKRDQFEEALEDYGRAYDQLQDPTSEVGLDYLKALKRFADILWQRDKYPDAAKHYERILQILDEGYL